MTVVSAATAEGRTRYTKITGVTGSLASYVDRLVDMISVRRCCVTISTRYSHTKDRGSSKMLIVGLVDLRPNRIPVTLSTVR